MLKEMDSNVKQSSTVTRKPMDTLFCYTVMQKEFCKKNFSRKTPVEDVVLQEDVDDPVKAVEAEEAEVNDDVLDLEVDSDGECFRAPTFATTTFAILCFAVSCIRRYLYFPLYPQAEQQLFSAFLDDVTVFSSQSTASRHCVLTCFYGRATLTLLVTSYRGEFS
ncbi:hypothetical protein E2C01_055464 [Portunus trituberculatus]|uniref:Uncharacterized protein n=1 Tax=Portunus trituberculatus TaxID=210409 RepID=A0A5B7GR93_PORTR|nr:hypothetical protein [Portunus trituberculatus]